MPRACGLDYGVAGRRVAMDGRRLGGGAECSRSDEQLDADVL